MADGMMEGEGEGEASRGGARKSGRIQRHAAIATKRSRDTVPRQQQLPSNPLPPPLFASCLAQPRLSASTSPVRRTLHFCELINDPAVIDYSARFDGRSLANVHWIYRGYKLGFCVSFESRYYRSRIQRNNEWR